jgi:beta-glucanase (GH16 family)
MWGGESWVYYSKPYTSAHLISNDAFKYGYYEIRSRFPKNGFRKIHNKLVYQSGEGFSPTFWLFPCNYDGFTGFVKYSEIDIYEVQGKTNKYTCNVHYADSNHYTLTDDGRYYSYWVLHDYAPDHGYEFNINDGDFHTYGMKWDSLSIRFYYDGNQICYLYSDGEFVPGYLVPMNIIIANSAYSGNFADSIKANTILPYPYDIDYVKVYHHVCDDETIVTDILDFSQYYYAVKKSISLGLPTHFPTDTITYLHATDFIELRAGFEISGTSQIKLIIDPPCHNETIQNIQP